MSLTDLYHMAKTMARNREGKDPLNTGGKGEEKEIKKSIIFQGLVS